VAHPSIDSTFYRTAADAAAAPCEQLAYVVAFDRAAQKHDAMTVIDVNPASDGYGRVVGWTDVPGYGGELHHFGWNACSSALKHEGHDIQGLERRYLLVPGLRTSDIHVLDTQPDPRNPTLIKTIDSKSLSQNAGYSRPHTLHCGPDGVFLTCFGGPEGNDDGPGGIALLDPRDIRRLARLGDRPRAAALPLRRLVARQSERADLERVG
jgi:selenium-binding protein 1